MKDEDRDFAARFAAALLAENFDAAHGFFAPWLQKEMTPADFRALIEERLREMNAIWGIEELIFPGAYRIDGNSSDLASLREDHGWRAPRRIPAAITDENFRRWMVIQFLPAANDPRVELDGWFDLWFILVETEGELRIGFFELADVD